MSTLIYKSIYLISCVTFSYSQVYFYGGTLNRIAGDLKKEFNEDWYDQFIKPFDAKFYKDIEQKGQTYSYHNVDGKYILYQQTPSYAKPYRIYTYGYAPIYYRPPTIHYFRYPDVAKIREEAVAKINALRSRPYHPPQFEEYYNIDGDVRFAIYANDPYGRPFYYGAKERPPYVAPESAPPPPPPPPPVGAPPNPYS